MKKSSLLVTGLGPTHPQGSPMLQNTSVGSVVASLVELSGTALDDMQKSTTVTTARQNIFGIFEVNNTRGIYKHWLRGKQTRALYFAKQNFWKAFSSHREVLQGLHFHNNVTGAYKRFLEMQKCKKLFPETFSVDGQFHTSEIF